MIIFEFLPNPIGKDIEGEWIKFLNNGSAPVDLSGWSVKDASGKIFKFSKSAAVAPGGYFQLDYSQSKISINNNGETLFLYDAGGKLIDKAEYAGAAPEGKPLIRRGNYFVFAGAEEKEEAAPAFNGSAAKELAYSEGAVLNSGREFQSPVLLICFLFALVLSVFFIYVFKNIKNSEEVD
jgi:hypothetical protein